MCVAVDGKIAKKVIDCKAEAETSDASSGAETEDCKALQGDSLSNVVWDETLESAHNIAVMKYSVSPAEAVDLRGWHRGRGRQGVADAGRWLAEVVDV